jgi:hypothetical protein
MPKAYEVTSRARDFSPDGLHQDSGGKPGGGYRPYRLRIPEQEGSLEAYQ